MAQVAVASAMGSLLSTKSSDYPKYEFSFTPFLRANGLAALVSDVPVCETYSSNGNCPLGRRCPKRHPTKEQPAHHHYGRSNDNYVCKHWLKGLCKKGDACDFLHEYNLRKMSECEFYKSNGYCQNGDECLYVHVKEDSKLPICEDYNKGFCEKGPRCGKRHVRRKLCEFFMAGFCPDGPECKNGVHLKSLTGRQGEVDDEKQRKGRVADLERREEDQRKEFGWKGRRGRGGGGGGRWRDKKDRDRR